MVALGALAPPSNSTISQLRRQDSRFGGSALGANELLKSLVGRESMLTAQAVTASPNARGVIATVYDLEIGISALGAMHESIILGPSPAMGTGRID
jgi:hypothetical protein